MGIERSKKRRMAYCKGFDEAKASKGRKEFPTRNADRLGKSTRLKHSPLQGTMGTIGKFTCFLLAQLCKVQTERLSPCSHIGFQAHGFIKCCTAFEVEHFYFLWEQMSSPLWTKQHSPEKSWGNHIKTVLLLQINHWYRYKLLLSPN